MASSAKASLSLAGDMALITSITEVGWLGVQVSGMEESQRCDGLGLGGEARS